ncbi:unnamed protein product [Rhizophagus irregularis]|uniref:Uncharacterized protein n=1 Tax=Rhizophagus irregularis TaxID=588596 RepID=A0A915Z5Q8_9GLOM|nr:unnamed protein product [Rhizophagus irregularis]CAB5362190.1 unnamed protein product [Rhizophagus irregularis]
MIFSGGFFGNYQSNLSDFLNISYFLVKELISGIHLADKDLKRAKVKSDDLNLKEKALDLKERELMLKEREARIRILEKLANIIE